MLVGVETDTEADVQMYMQTDAQTKPEAHPFEPFLPAGARILILGTFPPQPRKWGMPFYYPNFQNDFWRIAGLIFTGDKDHFITGKRFDMEAITKFCSAGGIALSDTAAKVLRLKGNASDKHLVITENADIRSMLDSLPDCVAVATTGQKATETFLQILDVPEPSMGGSSEFIYRDRKIKLYRMPSTSRAYPMKLEEKARFYRNMFRELNLLTHLTVRE